MGIEDIESWSSRDLRGFAMKWSPLHLEVLEVVPVSGMAQNDIYIPSAKLLHNYGKSPCYVAG